MSHLAHIETVANKRRMVPVPLLQHYVGRRDLLSIRSAERRPGQGNRYAGRGWPCWELVAHCLFFNHILELGSATVLRATTRYQARAFHASTTTRRSSCPESYHGRASGPPNSLADLAGHVRRNDDLCPASALARLCNFPRGSLRYTLGDQRLGTFRLHGRGNQ